MTDQNSATEYQIRPNELMSELGIKKDAYYDYLKFLKIEAQKDSANIVYLSQEQADLIRALRAHVKTTGRMEGFINRNSAMVRTEEASLFDQAQPMEDTEADRLHDQMDDLIRMAAELKGQRLVMPQLVVQQLAERMTYDDLPDDIKAKVDGVRESVNPKFQPAALADELLSQWRNRNQPATA